MSQKNWEWVLDLSLVEDKKLREEIVKILFMLTKLRIGDLETIKATYHTTNLKQRSRLNWKQPYRARKWSGAVLCEHIDEQLDSSVAKPALSKQNSSVAMVPKNDILWFCMDKFCLSAAITSESWWL